MSKRKSDRTHEDGSVSKRPKQEPLKRDLFVPGRICLFGEHSDWAGFMYVYVIFYAIFCHFYFISTNSVVLIIFKITTYFLDLITKVVIAEIMPRSQKGNLL